MAETRKQTGGRKGTQEHGWQEKPLDCGPVLSVRRFFQPGPGGGFMLGLQRHQPV